MAISLKSTYFSTYQNIFKLLPKRFKRKFFRVQILIILTSFVDIFGLAVFIPILAAVADEDVLKGKGVLAQIKNWSGIEHGNVFLLYLFILAFIFFILRSIFILFSNWIQNKYVLSISQYVGTKTYKHYLNSKYETFVKQDSASVVRELTMNPTYFGSLLVLPFLMVTAEFIVIFIVVLGIAIFNIQVFFLLIVTIFPIVLAFNLLSKNRVKKYGLRLNKLASEFYRASNRGILGFIDVKLRSKEEVLLEGYDKIWSKKNHISIRTSILAIVPAKLFELATIGGLLVIFWYGSFLADNPAIILPLLALYAAAGYRVMPSLSRILASFVNMQQYSYLFDTFKEPLSDKDSKLENKELNLKEINFSSKIEFKDISYTFESEPNNPFFKDLNFTISKSEIIGIIGKSGSGKTTLVKMLAGFLNQQSGAILIDDSKIEKNNMASWRGKISYVQQAPYLEKGSLAKNIAFLEGNIDLDQLKLAIKNAALEDLVGNSDPMSFEIDEFGKNLSGGQKQRIIIARALYHNAELIILDEATSALDNDTENEINKTVAQLKKSGVTVIIIAHRYSTLKHTDRIIEMEEGKIIKLTDYKEVVSRS